MKGKLQEINRAGGNNGSSDAYASYESIARNANEHDRKFGRLLLPTAASNEWRRNAERRRARKKGGNLICG
jgi:hypothetical protein